MREFFYPFHPLNARLSFFSYFSLFTLNNKDLLQKHIINQL
ncbi:hypothetical protein RV02_GL001423 [Enterococcus gilvus]|nr:hypothetical protein RV02_GL001423 [Enterococcus gilvus]